MEMFSGVERAQWGSPMVIGSDGSKSWRQEPLLSRCALAMNKFPESTAMMET